MKQIPMSCMGNYYLKNKSPKVTYDIPCMRYLRRWRKRIHDIALQEEDKTNSAGVHMSGPVVAVRLFCAR